MRKGRKGQFKKKARPVGHHSKKNHRKQSYATSKKSRGKRSRRSSSYGTGAVATAVGVGATAITTVATIGMFSKTTMLENDKLSKKVGISAATPAGVMFWGTGHVLRKAHPVAEAGFKGVGIGLVVTDLARVLLGKLGIIATVPESQPARDPATRQPAGALPTPEEVQDRRERDANEPSRRENRREERRRETPQGGEDAPRVRPSSTREDPAEDFARRQAQGSDNRIGSLFSLKRRQAA